MAKREYEKALDELLKLPPTSTKEDIEKQFQFWGDSWRRLYGDQLKKEEKANPDGDRAKWLRAFCKASDAWVKENGGRAPPLN